MIVVSDASPLIVVSGVGLFSFLKPTFGELHTTQAVFDEVVPEGEVLPGSEEVKKAQGDWIHVHPTPPTSVISTYRVPPALSVPDASILALSVTQRAEYLLSDDNVVRKSARRHNVTVVGTGGILIRFKQLGHIQSVKDKLEQAVSFGLRLDENAMKSILALAGEGDSTRAV